MLSRSCQVLAALGALVLFFLLAGGFSMW